MSSTPDPKPAADPVARPTRERPARPAFAPSMPSPLRNLRVPPPAAMATSVWMWVTSSVLGGVALTYAVLKLTVRREQLRIWAATTDATLSADRVASVVRLVIIGALIGIAVPMIAQLVLALLMRSGRRWARVVLTVLTAATVPAVAISAPALAVDGSASNYVVLASALALVLAVVALILMFVPSSNRWLRERRRR